MGIAALPTQLVVVAGHFHKLAILLFGYFIPALSSVKAVVRKDAEAYHQWSTYWLILHLYITILSPLLLLHLTLHPIFQLLAILWLSLPRFQGASVVYERLVNPWVDQYESKVDDAVEEAHRGVRRWVWSRLGGVVWMLIGEGGSLAGGLCNLVMEAFGVTNLALQPSNSAESSSLPPRHSLREALSKSSSSNVDGDGDFLPTKEFVRDFLEMLHQGLYVFSNAHTNESERAHFRLCIFSYAKENNGSGAFLLSAVATGDHDAKGPTAVRLPLDNMMPVWATGEQGLGLECNNVTVEIVLSDEGDRNILLNGLNACLPPIIRDEK